MRRRDGVRGRQARARIGRLEVSLPNPVPRAAVSPVGFALVVALVVAYGFCVPLAAAKDGDFSHLWVGGRALVVLGSDAVYDPAAHRALLTDALGSLGPDLWAARNDQLGAFFYPPVAALLYAPLGALELRAAAGVHAAGLIVAALAVAGGLVVSLRRPGFVVAIATLLLFPSFFFAFVLGQNGLWALAVVVGGGLLALRGRPLVGGLVLGLLAAKPSWWMAFAAVAPLCLRSPRLLTGMVAGAVGMVGVGLTLGLGPTLAFADLAPQLARLDQLSNYPLHLQHNLSGLSRRWMGMESGTYAGWLISLVFVAVAVWRAPHLARPRVWALACVTATLINPHVHHYDLLVGLVGVVALAGVASRGGRPWLWAFVVLHHAAFVIEVALDLDEVVSLPALALVGVWAALVAGVGDRSDPR